MSLNWTWTAFGLTVAVLALYEALSTLMQFRRPERLARSAHASLRQEWFEAVSAVDPDVACAKCEKWC